MRTFLIVSVVLLVCFSSAFWGCQKEDLGNLDSIFSDTTQNGPISKMTAKVNDTPWIAIAADATVMPGQIDLTGMDNEGKRIGFTIYSNTVGDYLLKYGVTNNARFYPDSITNIPFSSSATLTTGGVINISSIDTVNGLMSGDFNFIAARTTSKVIKTVTEGVFTNISFINSNKRDPFSVLKNGTKWIPATYSAVVSGTTLTITATDASGDTTVNLMMPSTIKVSTKPYPITPIDPITHIGTYTASVTEKYSGNNINLSVDTTKATAKLLGIKPSLLILSNNGSVIQGAFSFVAFSSLPRIRTTFRAGSFYLKYK